MESPARFSRQRRLDRSISDVFDHLSGKCVGLLFVEEPVRRKDSVKAKDLLLQFYYPGHTLLRDMSELDGIAIAGLDLHGGLLGMFMHNERYRDMVRRRPHIFNWSERQ